MDKKSFERFYNEHFDKVYRFVFFRVGNDKALAEDLVSDIFLKALKAFDSFDEARGHSAWILTITKNHLANHWRDTKPAVALPSQDSEPSHDTQSDDAWLLAAGKKQQDLFFIRQELVELLSNLSSDEQEIVTFHYLSGYSYLEIAKERGVTEGAVKTMAHRAIKKMRNLL